MSWSISKTLNHEQTDVGLQKDLDVLNEVDRANVGNQQCEKERDEQINAAIRATFQMLVDAGFDNAKEISVSMSGHANKNHGKDDSWSNEFISINVFVKTYKEE